MASFSREKAIDENVPPQRKTTLKWGPNGELSEIDMARILSRLNNSVLTSCEITCDAEGELRRLK
tara:strand:- start:278 stop:472 length:195 start_codon:yes stop_codon:yes gene_type:complete